MMWPVAFSRVVFVNTRWPHMGGVSTYVEAMSDAFREAGVDVEHISILPGTREPRYPTSVVFHREELHSGPVFRGRGPYLRRVWALPIVVFKKVDRAIALRRFRRKMEALGNESVAITDIKAMQVLRESGYRRRSTGPLVIGQFHSSFESIDHEPWLREALPREYAACDVVTALTEEDAVRLEELIGVPCHGVGNPIPAGIRPSRHDRPVAVALARFSYEKQLDVMIRCFADATSTPDLAHWQLHIYGEGDLEPQLRECIGGLDVGERIQLMGKTDDVASVMEGASLNLLTSLYEGFGMTILEAAAAGIPSVVFDCSPGVRLLVGGGRGYLVRANDEAAYALQLRETLLDGGERNLRGHRALNMALEYVPHRIVARMGEIVEAARDVATRQ